MSPLITITPGTTQGREAVHVLGQCAGMVVEDTSAVTWIAVPVRGPITEHSTRDAAVMALLTSEEM